MTHPADEQLMQDLSAAIQEESHQSTQNISVMSPELVHASVVPPSISSPAQVSRPLPPAPVSTPTSLHDLRAVPVAPVPLAITPTQSSPRHRSIFAKLGIVFLLLCVLAGIGSGISFAMTGSWLPPQVSSLFAKYSKDQLFSAMVARLPSIKTVQYNASLDYSIAPYDGLTPRMPFAGSSTMPQTLSPVGGSVPNDFSIHADLQGSLDMSDTANILGKDAELKGTVTGSVGGVSFTTSAAVRKVHNTAYLQVNKLPSLGLFDLSTIEGAWIAFDSTSLDELGITDILNEFAKAKLKAASSTATDSAEAKVREQFNDLLARAKEKNILRTVYEDRERIGATNSWRYGVSFDQNAFIDMLVSAKSDFANVYGASSILASVHVEELQNPSTKAILDYFLTANKMQVWIDPNTAWPVKFALTSTVAPPEGDMTIGDNMLVTKSSLTLARINEPIALVAPSDFISAVEAYASLMGQTLDEYYEAKQESNVSSIFYALSDFKKAAGVYPLSLHELTQTPNEIRRAYPQTAPKKSPVKTGFDFAPWGDDLPILRRVPKDVFTKSEYTYTNTKKDFTLVYEIRLATTTTSSYLPVQFINGTNTMKSNVISVEGAALAKKKR